MGELLNDFPKQHDYIETNRKFYLISIIAYAVSCYSIITEVTAGLAICALSVWYMYIMIWNVTQKDIVWEEDWLAETRWEST